MKGWGARAGAGCEKAVLANIPSKTLRNTFEAPSKTLRSNKPTTSQPPGSTRPDSGRGGGGRSAGAGGGLGASRSGAATTEGGGCTSKSIIGSQGHSNEPATSRSDPFMAREPGQNFLKFVVDRFEGFSYERQHTVYFGTERSRNNIYKPITNRSIT